MKSDDYFCTNPEHRQNDRQTDLSHNLHLAAGNTINRVFSLSCFTCDQTAIYLVHFRHLLLYMV